MSVGSDLVLEVDFNNIDALDRIVASLRFANHWRRPNVGEWVRLTDAEGNVCVGQVEEIRNLIVAVRPDWGLWSSAVVTEPFLGGVRTTSSVDPALSALQ
jgi:hypothetical protein